MADEIHDGMQRVWTLTFNGQIDTAKEPEVTIEPPDFCTVIPGEFDPTAFTLPFTIQHAQNVGDAKVTANVDGDPSPDSGTAGIRKLSKSRDFTFLAPSGATAVTDALSDETPITQP